MSALAGMSLRRACEYVRDKAIEQLDGKPEVEIGFWTEMGNKSVMVGIARRGKAAVAVLVPKEEYDALKLLQILGVE
jgi:hypothetical protein